MPCREIAASLCSSQWQDCRFAVKAYPWYSRDCYRFEAKAAESVGMSGLFKRRKVVALGVHNRA